MGTAQPTWIKGINENSVHSFGNGARESLQNALIAGRDNINNAVATQRTSLDNILANGENAATDSRTMRDNATTATQYASDMAKLSDGLVDSSSEMANAARDVSSKANDIYNEAAPLLESGGSFLEQANAIINGNRSLGGISGEWLSQLSELDPNRFVVNAAADTQTAFDNSRNQSARELARRGVSAGSGNALALDRQFQQALASALAAAKTAARQRGIDAKTNLLKDLTAASTQLAGAGTTQTTAGLNAKTSAAGLGLSAASAMGNAANIKSQAANILGNAANLTISAGNLFGSASGIDTRQLVLEQSAYDSYASAQQAAANYYLNAARAEITANTAGSGRVISTTTSSSAPKSDWMNWNGTGHSESWNHNHN